MSYNNLEEYLVPRSFFDPGGLWLWGVNSYGKLGTNNTTGYSSPVQTVSSGTNWKQVSCGTNHTAVIKTDGTLWMWGGNGDGQLGTNGSASALSPVQTVSGGTNWKQVAAGKMTTATAAIKTDGTLWTWGRGFEGQLGNNASVRVSSPVQTVAGGTNWKQVSMGYSSTAAIKTDGTLWTWGNNVGDNTSVTRKSSPVQTAAGGTNWKLVSCGFYATAAIKTDGTLWLWGWNTYGQLGTNNTTFTSSPVQTVAAGNTWKSVNLGIWHCVATKTDGTLWTWGGNADGQLGTNDTINQSSPVQTVTGGTNWKLVSACGYGTAAIKTDGTLWGWGRNNTGQLGNNDTTGQSSPVQTIASGTNWRQIVCGTTHIAAINGTWGTVT